MTAHVPVRRQSALEIAREIEANARLIAAAPEALEKAEALCTATVVRDRMEAKRRPKRANAEDILKASEATLAAVRAAIAKARGQA